MSKSALITGITGQDGAYLAQLLLQKGYKVYGIVRRLSTPNLWRLNYLGIEKEVNLIDGDLTDQQSLAIAVKLSAPDEVYNLAAQSFVGTSWAQPVLTCEVDGLGVVKILNSVRDFAPKARFYQASTSEMYGNSHLDGKQDEKTPLHPRSPYAIAKLYAHWMTINYRESYNMFNCCGILFNHESSLRGIEFVTRKITDGVARIKLGLADKLVLGNLDSKRDWGFAGDYVEAMWMMLQKDHPDDYVVSTGENHSVREFCQAAFAACGIDDFEKYVVSDAKFIRPAELDELCGVCSKATEKLGWRPKVHFEQLVKMMVIEDLKRLSIRSHKDIFHHEQEKKEIESKVGRG
ncbi:GDP-mannose 4,6-dehydratase [Candidatus Peregrinibacteria bacterium]|nr:GDP-mannose 4,6-dehydratase [Candidatus Peregrinibacteria bacterium]